MRLDELLRGRWVKHPVPILRVGGSGEWDDLMADCPDVISDNGRYYLFYTGHSTKTHKWAIGFAESKDLYNWKKFGGNPILESGDGWDRRIDGPAVFKHIEKYYMFYEASSTFSLGQNRLAFMIPYGARKKIGVFRRWIRSFRSVPISQAVDHAAGRAIGYAVSDDMITWQKCVQNPVLTPRGGDFWDASGVFSPYVLLMEGSFYLFYGGSDGKRISSGIAVSDDLCKWERKGTGPILVPGPEGSWDDSSVLVVTVIRLEDAYVAFYEGQDTRNKYAIGFTYSHDFKGWTKFSGNPILTHGPKGAIDERMINSPHVIINDEKLYMFYGSQDFKMQGHSTIAYLENE